MASESTYDEQLGEEATPPPIPSVSENAEGREEEERSAEAERREGVEGEDDRSSPEPSRSNKRDREEDEDGRDEDGRDDKYEDSRDEEESGRRVRRRLTERLYLYVPSGGEWNQNIIEYSTPVVLPHLFRWLGFNSHAETWCWAIVVLHTMQTAVSDFGPHNKSIRWKAWISPLNHLLIDTAYMQAMVTAMCLKPTWFVDQATNKPLRHVQWISCFMVFNLMVHTCSSLKMEYTRQKVKQVSVDPVTVSTYTLASILLLHPSNLSMWMGLFLFNCTPFYIVWAFQQLEHTKTV
ncbi:expressed unknown protein [Seminavis robusta]|uniref:Uncharacterized protein n=1 Tax=Seminavis robusta TaxID=568900 RepID=A0A9N8E284_9STRA|nr:expressed unknown protein [Seminavis robusta]|eukprot:Sro483_g152090.1 n/a (293) ;mRNA; r:38487-39365